MEWVKVSNSVLCIGSISQRYQSHYCVQAKRDERKAALCIIIDCLESSLKAGEKSASYVDLNSKSLLGSDIIEMTWTELAESQDSILIGRLFRCLLKIASIK